MSWPRLAADLEDRELRPDEADGPGAELPAPSMTAAKPPARQRAVGALASGFATAELHHHRGVRHAKLTSACE